MSAINAALWQQIALGLGLLFLLFAVIMTIYLLSANKRDKGLSRALPMPLSHASAEVQAKESYETVVASPLGGRSSSVFNIQDTSDVNFGESSTKKLTRSEKRAIAAQEKKMAKDAKKRGKKTKVVEYDETYLEEAVAPHQGGQYRSAFPPVYAPRSVPQSSQQESPEPMRVEPPMPQPAQQSQVLPRVSQRLPSTPPVTPAPRPQVYPGGVGSEEHQESRIIAPPTRTLLPKKVTPSVFKEGGEEAGW